MGSTRISRPMTRQPIQRIAVNTGGGDAPGLNAVIRSVTLAARRRGWDVLGIRRGYEGLMQKGDGGILRLDEDAVRGISHQGGTILGAINKGNPFEYPIRHDNKTPTIANRSNEVVRRFRELEIDALIAIGGDGSMRIAHRFIQKGIPVIGVPKTIDNDLMGTVVTFGFDTAVTVATEAVDRLHSTAQAHQRVFVVEVMGRYAGWIALHAGIAGTADVILLPEIPFDIDSVCRKIHEREASGRHFTLVVVAEGAKPVGGETATIGTKEAGREVRLGGVAEQVAEAIAQRTGKETRTVVLGHLQRGGGPTARDRLISMRFGAAAVRVLDRGERDVMVALDPPDIRTVPIADIVDGMKAVPIDGDTVATARDLGICLGD